MHTAGPLRGGTRLFSLGVRVGLAARLTSRWCGVDRVLDSQVRIFVRYKLGGSFVLGVEARILLFVNGSLTFGLKSELGHSFSPLPRYSRHVVSGFLFLFLPCLRGKR